MFFSKKILTINIDPVSVIDISDNQCAWKKKFSLIFVTFLLQHIQSYSECTLWIRAYKLWFTIFKVWKYHIGVKKITYSFFSLLLYQKKKKKKKRRSLLFVTFLRQHIHSYSECILWIRGYKLWFTIFQIWKNLIGVENNIFNFFHYCC